MGRKEKQERVSFADDELRDLLRAKEAKVERLTTELEALALDDPRRAYLLRAIATINTAIDGLKQFLED